MTQAATKPLPGTPCWVSLMARDLNASQEFYGELFGWEFHRDTRQLGPHLGPHLRAQLGDLAVAGLGEITGSLGLPVAWMPYVAVEDADASCALIRESGGTVGVGPLESEWGGRVAVAADPSGAAFGVWQTDGNVGVSPDGRPGTSIWNELTVHDSAQVTTFYSTVFGYEIQPLDVPEADYHTMVAHGHPVGGLNGVGKALPRGHGALWVTYFAVRSVVGAAGLVEKLGGSLTHGPRESPYGLYARVRDREGAPFAVIEMSDPRDAVERPLRAARS